MPNTSTEPRPLTDAEIDLVAGGGLLGDTLSPILNGLPIVGPILGSLLSPIIGLVDGLVSPVTDTVTDIVPD